jgi:hypothetical protein
MNTTSVGCRNVLGVQRCNGPDRFAGADRVHALQHHALAVSEAGADLDRAFAVARDRDGTQFEHVAGLADDPDRRLVAAVE